MEVELREFFENLQNSKNLSEKEIEKLNLKVAENMRLRTKE